MDLIILFVRYFGAFCVILTPVFTVLFVVQYRDTVRYANIVRRRVARADLISGLVGCVFLFTLGLGLFAVSFVPYQGA